MLIFSPCCVPDIVGTRKLYHLPADLPEEEVAEFAWQRARTAAPGERLACHLQKIVSIACLRRDAAGFSVCSFSGEESVLLKAWHEYSASVDELLDWEVLGQPGLQPWQVLTVRGVLGQHALRSHGARANLAQEMLAMDPAGHPLPLQEMICLAGVPDHGDGAQITAHTLWQRYRESGVEGIEAVNEARVLSTGLLWLRYLLNKGVLSHAECLNEYALLRKSIQSYSAPHLQAWFEAWSGA